MNYKLFLISFFSVFSIYCFAQEQIGLRTENYSGVNSVLLNPANNLTTPFQWDVNLVAVGQFIDNNFGGFSNASIGDILNAREDVLLATDFPSDHQFQANSVVFDFEAPGKNKFGTVTSNVMGPAIMLNFDQHSFGFFTNLRVALSGQKIPAVLGYYDYKNVLPGEDYTVFPSNLSGMAWSELGVNYLFKKETANGRVGIGINLKYLQGYESFFIKNKNNMRITKMERDVIIFQNGVDIDFGFTNSSIDAEEINLKKSGTGFGLDLGLTFATTEYEEGYGLKVGASILDIGKIKFNKNTEFHQINITGQREFNPRNLDDATDFRDALDQLNEELFGDTTTSLSGHTYEIWTPSALSLQADVAIQKNIYVNATLIQRMPIGEINLERGNMFALTPRYESRWISAFLPVSVYNWQHIKVGTALRLAFLTIGTEDLGSFFGKKNLTGTDFYAAIKINPFRVGRNNNRRSGKDVKCYEF